jgi:hypothetical protein
MFVMSMATLARRPEWALADEPLGALAQEERM